MASDWDFPPPHTNGQFPDSALKAIPGGRLYVPVANSWLLMRERIHDRDGVWICPTSARTAYRSYADQVYFWDLYKAGRGALAASPGTSNHGLGWTVDVPATSMREAIDRHGAEFGWAKRWSDAPSEWWHIKYDPAHDLHKGEEPQPPKPHAYQLLSDKEKRTRDVLVATRQRAKKKGWTPELRARAGRAKRQLTREIEAIDKAARKGTGPPDWKQRDRGARRKYLSKLLTGKAEV
jgi:hypothetical protein